MLDRASRAGGPLRELSEITAATDTRDYLKQATKQALAYDDYELIIDVDAHLQEGGFWHEIIGFLDNDVLKQTAQAMMRPGALPLINMQPGMTFQALAGRIPHQSGPLLALWTAQMAGRRRFQGRVWIDLSEPGRAVIPQNVTGQPYIPARKARPRALPW